MGLRRKSAVLALSLVMLAAPAMACIAPAAAMAMDGCCQPRPMADCGSMQVPAAKSCCSTPATPQPYSQAARSIAASLHLSIVAQVFHPALLSPSAHAARFPSAGGDSPPESPPGSISILRI